MPGLIIDFGPVRAGLIIEFASVRDGLIIGFSLIKLLLCLTLIMWNTAKCGL